MPVIGRLDGGQPVDVALDISQIVVVTEESNAVMVQEHPDPAELVEGPALRRSKHITEPDSRGLQPEIAVGFFTIPVEGEVPVDQYLLVCL